MSDLSQGERLDRMEHAQRFYPRLPLECGHEGELGAHPDCPECCYELGRRAGNVEAGAYYSWDEIRARLDQQAKSPMVVESYENEQSRGFRVYPHGKVCEHQVAVSRLKICGGLFYFATGISMLSQRGAEEFRAGLDRVIRLGPSIKVFE